MTTATSATPFEFDPEIKRRLGQIDIVALDGLTEESDKFDLTPLNCHQPFGQAQSKPVPGSKKPGYSEVYRNVHSHNKLISTWHPKVNTTYEAFNESLEKYGDRDCVGQRVWDEKINGWSKQYHWLTYTEVARKRTDFGGGLVNVVNKHAGLDAVGRKYIVSVYGPNCINWVIADLGCITQSLPTVCLYDTLGPDTSEYILNFCESPVIVCSLANITNILRLKPKLPNLKVVISMDPLHAERDHEEPGQSKKDLLEAWAKELDIGLYSMQEVEDIGAAKPVAHKPPKPDDIYAINFTSGTTGNPKGAILSHQNVIAGITMTRTNIEYSSDKQDTFYSFLPLAHIYERISFNSAISYGVRQGYPHGALTEIMDDIAVLKPDGITMVPRILNRITNSLKSLTIEASGMGGYISRKAFAAKVEHLRTTGSPHHAIWDRVWCKKIRKAIGFENVRFITTGSAPLSPENQEFLKVALAVELGQGYGLTESLSGISVSQPNDADCGSCGPVAPTCEVRLRDVTEFGYTADDKPEPRGEVMLRGPQIFRGYYHNNEKTIEAFDEDGWFHTGDVGKIDSKGRIYIIDRVKNFFKLAQGEYIGAEKIENVYQSRSSLLAQIFVHGYSTETFLVAIAGVNPDTFAPWVSKLVGKNISATDYAGMKKVFGDKKVRSEFLKHMNACVEPGVLQGFERVKNIQLAIEPLNMENDTVTPTLKIKRNVAAQVFKEQVDEMYKEGAQPISDKAKL